MRNESPKMKPIELHREMYQRRRREAAWYHGQTRKRVLERINSMPARDRRLLFGSNGRVGGLPEPA